ncbi:hypothetical protein [Halomonas heilongjiangensis]|uniref:Uncharacterized protein n=1 Tax=Halomonas heilongjiangensis TaxID=1387883 RepID=A0A2N7TP77_9GAMM|nr:hypothetical protein [Halomonas heilongjiangensis]PMR69908.1 hypothetical protein C1H66_09065 [Halomonas heilongjiangensis]PXX87983.1 hypothetical protein CR158_16760 [Halomonas heilongjiangensis]
MFRTLAMLRSLQSAHHTLEDARTTIQQACDYRWLKDELPHGVITATDITLPDGTPGLAITLAYPATPERRRGGRWPDEPAERERCRVEGAHACRAAGAPAYRTLEGLSQGLVHGAVSVLTEAARFRFLLDRQALRLTWRRVEGLEPTLARRLGRRLAHGKTNGGGDGIFLLEIKVPGRAEEASLDGAWLDRRVDRYRRIRPAPAGR